MIKRQSVRFLLRPISGPDHHRSISISFMASLLGYDTGTFLPKGKKGLGLHGLPQAAPTNERPRSLAMVSVDARGNVSPRINASIGLSPSNCHNKWVDDDDNAIIQKARVFAPYQYPQLVPADLEAGFEQDGNAKLANGRGHGAYQRGSPLGFPDHHLAHKIVVAVDVDEVLGNFVSALNRFIADRYSLNHSVSEYHVYEFFKIWNCSRDEADIRVHEFFKTSHFKTGIHPIPGAQQALHKLSRFCNLSVVTSRQNAIKDHTIEWIEKHYPGLFQEIHFGNHFALDGQSRPKSDICRSLGAKVLIDDNPRYAIECAEVGINVLLFDYENSYPWCKTESVNQHPLVTKVHDWEEVEQQLVSWIVS